MSLKQTRIDFSNQSGRLDLINADASDNGADFYINAGQRFLDRFAEHKHSEAKVYRKLSAGDYFIKLEDARVIHYIGIGTDDSFNWLEKYNPVKLREKFAKPFTAVSQARPKYYAPVIIRPSHSEDAEWDGISGFMITEASWESFNGLVFLPPADQEYHLEVWGKFYSPTLSADDDTSYWTEFQNYILVMAAQRALEIFYRNTQGVNDWTTAIKAELFEVEKDLVEENAVDIVQMEG